jgi:hypothetical protein
VSYFLESCSQVSDGMVCASDIPQQSLPQELAASSVSTTIIFSTVMSIVVRPVVYGNHYSYRQKHRPRFRFMGSRTDSVMTLVVYTQTMDTCHTNLRKSEWSRVPVDTTGKRRAISEKKEKKKALTAGFEPTRAMPK